MKKKATKKPNTVLLGAIPAEESSQQRMGFL